MKRATLDANAITRADVLCGDLQIIARTLPIRCAPPVIKGAQQWPQYVGNRLCALKPTLLIPRGRRTGGPDFARPETDRRPRHPNRTKRDRIPLLSVHRTSPAPPTISRVTLRQVSGIIRPRQSKAPQIGAGNPAGIGH